jgi:transposase-like protein
MKKKNSNLRTFSTAFKKEKVRMYEQGQMSVLEISRIYEVSTRAVYKWIKKYGKLPKGERVVVEKESEGAKTMELLKRIRDLESALGRKDMENTYLRAVIEKATEQLGYDIEKKYEEK